MFKPRISLLVAGLLLATSSLSHARLTDLPIPDIASVEALYQAGDYQALLSQIDTDAPPEQMSFRLRSLIKLEREDEAEAELEAWLDGNKNADASARAEGLKMAGDIYAAMAQQASMFSAPGLAGKSLEHYQNAHQLAPENLDIAGALFQFYLYAPGIVGGDEAKAREVALAMGKVSALDGQLALLDVALKQEDTKAFDAQLIEARKAFPKDRQLSLRQSRRFEEEHDKAAAALIEALAWGPQPDEDTELEPQLRYQLIKHAVKGEVYLEQAKDNIAPLFAELPDEYAGWAKLRRAQLMALTGDKEQARTWLKAAREQAPDDKRLQKEAKSLGKRL